MSPDRFSQESRLLGQERLRRKEDALRQRSRRPDEAADRQDAARRIAADVHALTEFSPERRRH